MYKENVVELPIVSAETTASSINNLHNDILLLEASAKDKAAEIGGMLIEVKRSLPHGEFTKWIECNCVFTDRQARRYILVAEAKRKRKSDFHFCTSINEVLELSRGTNNKYKQDKQPKPKMDRDDQRKVRKLQAVIDDPAADPNTVEACRRKLDGYKTAHGEEAVDDFIEQAKEYEEDYQLVDMEPIMDSITDIIFNDEYDLDWRKAQVQDWLSKAFDDDDNGMIAELNFLKEHKNDW